MAMGPVDPLVSYDIRSTTIKGGELTNLPLTATTWGQFIPTSWGNARVAGNQIWSSGFYSLITKATYEVSENQDFGSEYGVNLKKYGAQVGGDKFTREFSEAAIDIAWAFGYNGDVGTTRKVTKIRFDNRVIYDAATGESDPNYAFTIRYGGEDYQEPIMLAGEDDPTNVLYYKGMIVITFAAMREPSKGTAIPASVDIELTAGRTPDLTALVRQEIVSDFAFQSSADQIFADYERGVFYRYRPSLGPNGSFEQWDLKTYTLKKTVQINLNLPSGFANDKLGPIQFFRRAGLVLAQHRGPGDPGFSAVYLINPDIGNVIKSFGVSGYTFSNPPGSGIPFCDTVCQIMDRNQTTIGSPEGYSVGFSNDSTFRTFTIGFQDQTEGYSVYGFERAKGFFRIPDAIGPGKDGVGYARFGSKYYKLNFDGINPYIDVPYTLPGTPQTFLGTVGKDMVTVNGLNVYRFSELGSQIYVNTATRPDPGGASDDYFNQGPNVSNLTGRNNYSNNVPGYWGNDFAYLIDFADGSVQFTPVTGSTTIRGIGQLWDSETGILRCVNIGSGTSNALIQFPILSFGGSIKLRDFMRSLYINTGKYTADQIIFENIDDNIAGAIMAKAYKIGEVIDNICRLYRIEKIETPTQIKFYRNRTFFDSADIAFTITTDGLALVSDNDETRAAIVTTVRNPEQTAASIKLTYIDIDAGFVENSVEWRRPDAPADATTALNLAVPIVMTKNEALVLVQVRYTDTIAATTKHRIRLPQSRSNVSAGDLVKIVGKTFTDVVRLTTIDLNADQSVACECETVNTQVNAVIQLPDVPGTSRPNPMGSGDTKVLAFNVPALHWSHNGATGNFVDYLLGYGDGESYQAGYVARKPADGDWTQLFELTRNIKAAVFRTKTTALADVRHLFDRSTLPLEFLGGSWTPDQNTDYAGIIADDTKNVTLYGTPDRWEVMQTASVDLATMTATGFARGMRGSELNCGSHVVGDLLVILYGFVVREERPNSEIGKAETYRGVSMFQQFDKQANVPFTPQGTSLKPFAPYGVKAVRQANGNVLFTWFRRDKATPTKPGTPATQHSEGSISYEVDIYDNSGNVIRTITGSANSQNIQNAIYTVAQQQTDGTTTVSKITVAVYQMSAVVRRGFGKKVTIDVQ